MRSSSMLVMCFLAGMQVWVPGSGTAAGKLAFAWIVTSKGRCAPRDGILLPEGLPQGADVVSPRDTGGKGAAEDVLWGTLVAHGAAVGSMAHPRCSVSLRSRHFFSWIRRSKLSSLHVFAFAGCTTKCAPTHLNHGFQIYKFTRSIRGQTFQQTDPFLTILEQVGDKMATWQGVQSVLLNAGTELGSNLKNIGSAQDLQALLTRALVDYPDPFVKVFAACLVVSIAVFVLGFATNNYRQAADDHFFTSPQPLLLSSHDTLLTWKNRI